jgi:hypothetical protein
MKPKRSWIAVFVFAFLLWTVGGCGPASDRAAVKGKVTIDGAPLPEGVIEFVPLDKQKGQPGGSAIENGQYAIAAEKGLASGDYLVQIRADRPTGKKVWDGMGDERWPASKKNYVNLTESYLPARYNDRSALKATIELGKVNVHDYDLQLDKKGR